MQTASRGSQDGGVIGRGAADKTAAGDHGSRRTPLTNGGFVQSMFSLLQTDLHLTRTTDMAEDQRRIMEQANLPFLKCRFVLFEPIATIPGINQARTRYIHIWPNTDERRAGERESKPRRSPTRRKPSGFPPAPRGLLSSAAPTRFHRRRSCVCCRAGFSPTGSSANEPPPARP
jgi:hypothetical protein